MKQEIAVSESSLILGTEEGNKQAIAPNVPECVLCFKSATDYAANQPPIMIKPVKKFDEIQPLLTGVGWSHRSTW
jgi:hypothetical protein